MSEELVQNFSAITETPDLALCRAILNAHDGDLTAALNDFYARGGAAAAAAPRAAPQRPRRGLVHLLRAIFGGVFTFSTTVRGARVCVASWSRQRRTTAVSSVAPCAGADSRGRHQVVRAVVTLVLTPVLGPARLRAARQALTGARTEEDPAHAAATFVRELAAAYGGRHPRFLQCSYRDALQRAQQESKFLLLYLHSPEHQVRAHGFRTSV
jgi:FAS-associated factor 2